MKTSLSAKEMFEALGLMIFRNGNMYLEYTHPQGLSIEFNKEQKTIQAEVFTGGYLFRISEEELKHYKTITIAITQQMKELGWLGDETE